MREVIRIDKGVTRHPEHRMAEPVSLSIYEGEQIAIVGENGSGKSRLVDILISRFPLLLNEVKYDFTPSPYQLVSENIRHITFRDSYGTNENNYYYQLRWNQHEIGEDIPTAGSLLEHAPKKLIEMFHLAPVLNKPIITLSSGEMRKFQLTRALTTMPRVLVMDNPFIGLDAETRDQLTALMQTLIEETGLTLILVLSKTDDLPEFITHVLSVEGLKLKGKVTREEYIQTRKPIPTRILPESERDWIVGLKEKDISQIPFYPQSGGEILRFNDVSVRYGERTILSHLNWVVCEGERWALSGENGAGKSTLLSLVCADNPQGYACDIHLFGHRRGTGESIWEIKKHIGYVSPEMHRSYLKDIPAIDIVASGLNDSIGLYTRPKTEQRGICLRWMQVFGIRELAERTFLKLSSGEQRLCLLARAFVKDPELLILDEPLHGLDNRNRQRVREIIEAFCQRRNKTLIMVTHYTEELPPCIKKELYLTKNI